MKINKEIIEKLNPCKDRFDNFLEHYQDFDGDLKDFIILDKITYKDKVWVVTRLFSKKQNIKWAILCASSVLSKFEKKYPEDKRPRLAIEAAQKYLDEPTETNRKATSNAGNAAYAAYAAANTAIATSNATVATAYAAIAAANTAIATSNATVATAKAAAYAAIAAANTAIATAKAAATSNATVATAYNAYAVQQELNLKLMLECVI